MKHKSAGKILNDNGNFLRLVNLGPNVFQENLSSPVVLKRKQNIENGPSAVLM